jgi:dCMP deaminase
MISKDKYYLKIACAVSLRSNCRGRQVGAVVVRGDRIVATGYNGTPTGLKNCLVGGCKRCSDRNHYPSGTAYDLCICVHAEANAIATSARFGNSLEHSTIYVTHQPCFGCAKELLQAGIEKVFFSEPWTPDEHVRSDYEILQQKLGAQQLTIQCEHA